MSTNNQPLGLKIGPYQLPNNLMLAPMAGVTDLPMRKLCVQMGAGLAVSEMFLSNPDVWHTKKSAQRIDRTDEPGIHSVQIAGSEPALMAQAAQFNVELGAQIIDINMGCPAKKVNKKLAGSALLQYPDKVKAILNAVVKAVSVPVTLKIRTGWEPAHRNGVDIAKMAQDAGIQSLAVHGRTRACMYKGHAEYATIKAIKAAVDIPVIANGDITSPEKAKDVLAITNADGLMIGRGAQGNPWIFAQISHYLATGSYLQDPTLQERWSILTRHIQAIHDFYPGIAGVRIARKHVGWYVAALTQGRELRALFNTLETADAQLEAIDSFFKHIIQTSLDN